jgi:hypothetical protein
MTAPKSRACPHERVELSDDIRYGIAQVLKRLNHGRELEHLNIAKEYVDGRIGVLVKLNAHPRAEAHEASTTVWPHAKGGVIYRHAQRPIWVQDFHMSDLRDTDNGGQGGVLIDIIERIEAVDFLSGPTWVCREGDEELLRIGAGCFYSVTRGFVISPISSTHGKMDVSVLVTFVQPNQFPCGMVEGSTEIVDGIADHQGKGGRYFLAEAHVNGYGASLRIAADAKRMGVSLFKRVESTLEITDVLIGPLDFLQGTREQGGT